MRSNLGFAAGILFGWGMLLTLSPVALYMLVHGDATRESWIAKGPEPLRDLAGWPGQLALYAGLIAAGVIVMAIGLVLGHARRRSTRGHAAWLA